MAGTERLAAEGDAEPPGGVADGRLEVADGGVAAHPGTAAVGEGGEAGFVDSGEGHAEGLEGNLELECGEEQGLTFLAGGGEGGAEGGGVEGATAEGIGEGREGEGKRGEGERVGGRMGTGEEVLASRKEDGRVGYDGVEE